MSKRYRINITRWREPVEKALKADEGQDLSDERQNHLDALDTLLDELERCYDEIDSLRKSIDATHKVMLKYADREY
jgi:hypothetical protein